MDAIRKQLDVLMGANRNGDVREVNRKYYDRDVCRLFLVGLCPHDLFQLTKMDMGPCPKIHSFQLRKDYEEAKAKGGHNFDRELEDVIERLIVECERKIQRALKRLEDEDAEAAVAISVSKVTQTPEVIELSKQIKEKLKEADAFDFEGKTESKIRTLEVVEQLKAQRADKQSVLLLDAFNKDRAALLLPNQNPQVASLPAVNPPDARTQEMINEKLKKAEELGEKGMIDEAQKALEEAEALKKLGARQEPVLESSKYSAADVRITDQKLRVCDICGAFLSVYDNDRRLADHFGGKLHLGYMQIREKLAELQYIVIGDGFIEVAKGLTIHGVGRISVLSDNCNHLSQRNCKQMHKLSTSIWKRGIKKERMIELKMIGDLENEVGIMMELKAGIEMQIEMPEIKVESMIEEIGNMIDIMIEIVEIEIEIMIYLAATIQEAEGHVLALGIVPEIMIGIGVMVGTENAPAIC